MPKLVIAVASAMLLSSQQRHRESQRGDNRNPGTSDEVLYAR